MDAGQTVSAQQLFYHWSEIGSLWSSQEFISTPVLDFLKHILPSLSCIAETFPTLV